MEQVKYSTRRLKLQRPRRENSFAVDNGNFAQLKGTDHIAVYACLSWIGSEVGPQSTSEEHLHEVTRVPRTRVIQILAEFESAGILKRLPADGGFFPSLPWALRKTRREGGTGFFVMSDRIWASVPEVGCAGIALYAVLCAHADGERKCFPGQKRIGTQLGVCREWVRRVTRKLQAKSLLVVGKRAETRDGQKGQANEYHLLDFAPQRVPTLPANPMEQAVDGFSQDWRSAHVRRSGSKGKPFYGGSRRRLMTLFVKIQKLYGCELDAAVRLAVRVMQVAAEHREGLENRQFICDLEHFNRYLALVEPECIPNRG